MRASDRWAGKGGFRFVAALSGLSVIAFVSYRIGRPLHIDDSHSTYQAFDGIAAVIGHLTTDSHPPLYFLLLSLWMPVAGMGEVALRIPSILFYLGTGGVLFAYGRRVGDGRLGLMMALFFLANPLAIQHAHTVRMYAPLGFFCAVSSVLFLILTEGEGRGRRGIWIAYVGANVLGTFTHYWFFFLLVAQGAGALLLERRSTRWSALGALALSVVPFGFLWTPVLLQQMQGGPTSWLGSPSGFWWVDAPLRLYGPIYERVPAAIMYGGLVLACAVRLDGRSPKLARAREVAAFLRSRDVWHLAIMVGGTLLLAYGISHITPVYHRRYLITAIPPLAMLMALALWRLGDQRLTVVFCAAFAVGSGYLHRQSIVEAPHRDDRAAAQYIVDNYREGDELIYVTLSVGPMTHYLRALAPEREFSSTVFPAEVGEHIGWRDVDALLADPEALEREAETVVDRLKSKPVGASVFLFVGRDSAIVRPLVERIEGSLPLVERAALPGWWQDEVQRFGVTR